MSREIIMDPPERVPLNFEEAPRPIVSIPILENHDHTKVIGTMRIEAGKAVVQFEPAISHEELLQILPGAGFRVLSMRVHQCDGTGKTTVLLERIELIEISRVPT